MGVGYALAMSSGWCGLVVVLLSVGAYAEPVRVETVGAGAGAAFHTVQAAVDAAPGGHVEIRIEAGVYREKVHIAAADVTLVGMGAKPEDTVLVFSDTHASAGGTSASASVTVSGDGFRARNLTIANDFEKTHARMQEGSQAVALLVTGDEAMFEHVRLLGYQDTLYANSKTCHGSDTTTPCRASRQYYRDCYIEGHVDFIFGDAKAVFERCEIHALASPMVMLTAQSRLFAAEDSGYWFLHCRVTAAEFEGRRRIILGRPWRAYSTVYWVDTDFEAPIAANGWDDWDGKLKTATYGEYGSHGAGANLGGRYAGAAVVTGKDVAGWTFVPANGRAYTKSKTVRTTARTLWCLGRPGG
jgi:pectinesterase